MLDANYPLCNERTVKQVILLYFKVQDLSLHIIYVKVCKLKKVFLYALYNMTSIQILIFKLRLRYVDYKCCTSRLLVADRGDERGELSTGLGSGEWTPRPVPLP